MKPSTVVDLAPNTGTALELRTGDTLTVIGLTVVDLVAFDRADLQHRFDQARTKSNQAKLFLSTGDRLFSKRNRVMMTLTHDGFPEGRHDLEKGMCSRERFRLVASGGAVRRFSDGVDRNPSTPAAIPDHGCWENLQSALSPYGIAPDDIPSPFNVFQTMEIDPASGALLDVPVRPARPASVRLLAEMDLLVGVSACPESGRGRAVKLEVREGSDLASARAS